VARQPIGKPLEHIIVETSGLAHPGPVAALFWVDDELESRVKLDGEDDDDT
jgi:G3E family GTPase